LEEFIVGRHPSLAELISRPFRLSLAKKLAELHKINLDKLEKTPRVQKVIEDKKMKS
jgi:hypothetical protein